MIDKTSFKDNCIPIADARDLERDRLLAGADELRQEMEDLSFAARDLVVAQPPIQLLGYLFSQLHMTYLTETFGSDDKPFRDSEEIGRFQFALEYVHAVWSCHSELADETSPFDEEAVTNLFQVLERLRHATLAYCMASSAASGDPDVNSRDMQVALHAKTTWTLIRGHRYQVLEAEFFRFVLEPHAEALREAYGMEFGAIATGIQNIADAFRSGLRDAVETLHRRMRQTNTFIDDSDDELPVALARIEREDPSFANEMSGALRDLFFGGVCNLSRHSGLSEALLSDLSYTPGENGEFFAGGDFAGTPMRTLPARIRPGIKLGGEFYATDGQFIRDSAYRAIQWGLWKRLP